MTTPNQDQAIAAIQAERCGEEQVCVRLFGLDRDLWLDSEAVSANGGVYEYLETVLEDEDYAEYIDGRDYMIVDTYGDLTAALCQGEWINWVDYATAEELSENMPAFAIRAGLYLGIPLENIEEAYQGSFQSDEDFAEEFVDSTGMLSEVPETLRSYFDYERYARDLMMDHASCDGEYFSMTW